MPILGKEHDIYPADLLTNPQLLVDEQAIWYSIYTLSRREKDLMRKLYSQQIRFYGPVITKRFRSPAGTDENVLCAAVSKLRFYACH